MPQRKNAGAYASEKHPDYCPYCKATRLIRKGTRRKKLESVQRWQCLSCKHLFTSASPSARNKTYSASTIIDALTFYNLGHSLPDVIKRLKWKHGVSIAPSTVSGWLAENREVTTYRRLRPTLKSIYSPTTTIRSTKLYHRQVYSFAYHRPKIAMLRRSKEHARFSVLGDFIESVPKICPHALFRDGARASEVHTTFADPRRIIIEQKQNAATQAAALVIPSVGDNRQRHEALQQFMLANDSVTIAVEIPIWLTPDTISAIERKYQISLTDPDARGAITGHIDFIQVRNGAVHILDYKPDARTNKPIAQLAIYALALTELAGLKLLDIKCAWFNEHEYCEFFPRKLFTTQ